MNHVDCVITCDIVTRRKLLPTDIVTRRKCIHVLKISVIDLYIIFRASLEQLRKIKEGERER